jgi:pimeloyl-ACP methyl ester carboxylesterase
MSAVNDVPEPDRAGSVLSVSKTGFHRLAYVEWGDPAAKHTAVCVHGLSRQGRDFDPLASALAARGWRVICPDLPGRGRSEWLRNSEDYNLPQYVMDMTVLIARLGVTELDWVGTSLGGLIGMVIAGQPGAPIRRLVINDIGPFIPWHALHRLAMAVRNAPRAFTDLEGAIEHYRRYLAPFGNLSEDQWRHLARHNMRQLSNGSWGRLSDPEIAGPFRPSLLFNLTLWTYWDAITCPTLVLRGAASELLPAPTAQEMSRRGPRAEIVEIAGCGHAPALLNEHQIGIITGWLQQN